MPPLRRTSAAAALDAVELMNVGVNYMREHMPSDARIHYAVLDTGGIAPMSCKPMPRTLFDPRPRPARHERAGAPRNKVAQGAALMTETKMEMRIISAVSNLLPNTPLEQSAPQHHGRARAAAFRRNGQEFRGERSAPL